MRPKTGSAFFNNNHVSNAVTHGLRPACFRTELSVPGGTSILRFPATVTVPVFVECRNCRWLPFILTCSHPSSSSNLIKSLTFMPWIIDDDRFSPKYRFIDGRYSPRLSTHRPTSRVGRSGRGEGSGRARRSVEGRFRAAGRRFPSHNLAFPIAASICSRRFLPITKKRSGVAWTGVASSLVRVATNRGGSSGTTSRKKFKLLFPFSPFLACFQNRL